MIGTPTLKGNYGKKGGVKKVLGSFQVLIAPVLCSMILVYSSRFGNISNKNIKAIIQR
jgi:hypothetical protein